MVIPEIWHIWPVKSRPSLKEAKGSLKQGCCSDVTSEGSRRQKRGSTYRYAPYQKVEGRQI